MSLPLTMPATETQGVERLTLKQKRNRSDQNSKPSQIATGTRSESHSLEVDLLLDTLN